MRKLRKGFLLGMILSGLMLCNGCTTKVADYEYFVIGIVTDYVLTGEHPYVTLESIRYQNPLDLTYEEYDHDRMEQLVEEQGVYDESSLQLAMRGGETFSLLLDEYDAAGDKELLDTSMEQERILKISLKSQKVTGIEYAVDTLYKKPQREYPIVGELMPGYYNSFSMQELPLPYDKLVKYHGSTLIEPFDYYSNVLCYISGNSSFDGSDYYTDIYLQIQSYDLSLLDNLDSTPTYMGPEVPDNYIFELNADFIYPEGGGTEGLDAGRVEVLSLVPGSIARQLWLKSADNNVIFTGKSYAHIFGNLSFAEGGRIRADISQEMRERQGEIYSEVSTQVLWCSLDCSSTKYMDGYQDAWENYQEYGDFWDWAYSDYVSQNRVDSYAGAKLNPCDCFSSYYRLFQYDADRNCIEEINPCYLYVDEGNQNYESMTWNGQSIRPYYYNLFTRELCYYDEQGEEKICPMEEVLITYPDGETRAPLVENYYGWLEE